MFSRDEMQRAIEDALKTMEGIALELYRRGREEAREELETVKRERDEWRDKFHALNQTAGELCDACGWAFKIPGEPCRCEVVRERDEARAELATLADALDDIRHQRDRCHVELKQERAEVERLRREHDEMFAELRDLSKKYDECDAYRRGAEAMREACLGVVERFMDLGSPHPMMIAHKMSALPIPEDK